MLKKMFFLVVLLLSAPCWGYSTFTIQTDVPINYHREIEVTTFYNEGADLQTPFFFTAVIDLTRPDGNGRLVMGAVTMRLGHASAAQLEAVEWAIREYADQRLPPPHEQPQVLRYLEPTYRHRPTPQPQNRRLTIVASEDGDDIKTPIPQTPDFR